MVWTPDQSHTSDITFSWLIEFMQDFWCRNSEWLFFFSLLTKKWTFHWGIFIWKNCKQIDDVFWQTTHTGWFCLHFTNTERETLPHMSSWGYHNFDEFHKFNPIQSFPACCVLVLLSRKWHPHTGSRLHTAHCTLHPTSQHCGCGTKVTRSCFTGVISVSTVSSGLCAVLRKKIVSRSHLRNRDLSLFKTMATDAAQQLTKWNASFLWKGSVPLRLWSLCSLPTLQYKCNDHCRKMVAGLIPGPGAFCVGSLQALRLPPTVQRYTWGQLGIVKWPYRSEWSESVSGWLSFYMALWQTVHLSSVQGAAERAAGP